MMGGNGVKKKCATWVVTTILQQKAEATRDQRERERRKKKERGASLLCCCCCCLPRSIRGGAAQIWGVCVCGAVARESGTCPPSPTKAPLSPREVNYSAIDAQARGESNAPRCVSVCVDLLFLRQLVTNTWFYASLTREHTLREHSSAPCVTKSLRNLPAYSSSLIKSETRQQQNFSAFLLRAVFRIIFNLNLVCRL